MATLTRKRKNVMYTMKRSLEMFHDSAKSPWLRWRLQQVIEGADASGGLGVVAFRTGIIPQEVYYFLEDMQQSRGFTEGFQETGKYVESKVIKQVIDRLTVYRWLLMFVAVAMTLGVLIWQFAVQFEMKGVMQSYLSSN